jgi:hypothetical protein
MTVSEQFKSSGNTEDMWAVVSLVDGTVFEGLVEGEKPYGIYLLIGGDPSRLSMFPWDKVIRVVYKLA